MIDRIIVPRRNETAELRSMPLCVSTSTRPSRCPMFVTGAGLGLAFLGLFLLAALAR